MDLKQIRNSKVLKNWYLYREDGQLKIRHSFESAGPKVSSSEVWKNGVKQKVTFVTEVIVLNRVIEQDNIWYGEGTDGKIYRFTWSTVYWNSKFPHHYREEEVRTIIKN